MATGWWASLWQWGRQEPQEFPRQQSRVPEHRPAPAPPAAVDDDAVPPQVPHPAPAGTVHDAPAAPPPASAVPLHTSGQSGRAGSPDPVRSTPLRPPPQTTGAPSVATLDNVIADLLAIEGANGAAIVDIDSGMALAAGGTPGFDLNVAAAGNSNVVRAKLRTIGDLELKDEVEDILITLGSQYHLINVLKGQGNSGLFIYLVLNRVTANLALARHKLRAVAGTVAV
jgi:predicted regulator of Ras-like GTPase activity (Roadblock/LC7/MglB family)